MVKHFERHGGDGPSWQATWLREKDIGEGERTAIEMRCLITAVYLSGTHDQVNGPCMSSLETITR